MRLEDLVSDIVHRVVREVMRQRLPEEERRRDPDPAAGFPPGKKSLLVLLTEPGQESEVPQWSKKMATVCRMAIGWCCRLSRSEEGTGDPFAEVPVMVLTERDRRGWIEAARSADIIAVPRLSIGTLAKIACLIDDEPVSAVVLHGLMNGKAVVISSGGVLPSGAQKLLVPGAIADAVSAYFRRVIRYGARLVPENRWQERVLALLQNESPPKKPLVHAELVRQWAEEGESRIELPPGVLITPLAREEANRLGISWMAGQEHQSPDAEED